MRQSKSEKFIKLSNGEPYLLLCSLGHFSVTFISAMLFSSKITIFMVVYKLLFNQGHFGIPPPPLYQKPNLFTSTFKKEKKISFNKCFFLFCFKGVFFEIETLKISKNLFYGQTNGSIFDRSELSILVTEIFENIKKSIF